MDHHRRVGEGDASPTWRPFRITGRLRARGLLTFTASQTRYRRVCKIALRGDRARYGCRGDFAHAVDRSAEWLAEGLWLCGRPARLGVGDCARAATACAKSPRKLCHIQPPRRRFCTLYALSLR